MTPKYCKITLNNITFVNNNHTIAYIHTLPTHATSLTKCRHHNGMFMNGLMEPSVLNHIQQWDLCQKCVACENVAEVVLVVVLWTKGTTQCLRLKVTEVMLWHLHFTAIQYLYTSVECLVYVHHV